MCPGTESWLLIKNHRQPYNTHTQHTSSWAKVRPSSDNTEDAREGGRDGGRGCTVHDASGGCDPSDRCPGCGGSGGGGGSAANYDSDSFSGNSVLDTLDYQSSGSTADGGKGSSSRRRNQLTMPAIMRRHLNCIKTVQMFKLSGGIFFLQLWMNRRRGHLYFSYQLNRRKGRRNCPGPDAVVTAVDSRISCIGVGDWRSTGSAGDCFR